MSEGLSALRGLAEKVGQEGIAVFGTLLETGVPPAEAARILNEREHAKKFVPADRLEAFHNSLEGLTDPEWHHLVLCTVEMGGHTISQAVEEVRNNRELVIRLLIHRQYRDEFNAVKKWLDFDRLSDDEQKRLRKDYVKDGPSGRFASLIRERIEAREFADAKKAMDERDAAIAEREPVPQADGDPGEVTP